MIFFLAGLLCLLLGAELLVRGASRLATAVELPPLIVGLTVVAFGTSAPELAVSVKASLSGQGPIALGNVIGSNIFNVLFILGLSALIVPLRVASRLVRLDVPLMIGLSLLTLLFALDGRFGRIDGLLFITGLLLYTTFLVRQGRAAGPETTPATDTSTSPEFHWRDIGHVIGGLALLVLGSRWLVDAATAFALRLGVSDLVIGLTIVAAGTSLPEVVTSLVAAARGERDIAVGNVVGSNLFNLMGVLGLSALVTPAGIDVSPAIIRFDLPAMLAVAFVCLPVFFTGGRISRAEGLFLLAAYAAYTAYLVLAATHHAALPAYSQALLWFVLPLVTLTLAATTLHTRRRLSTRNSP